jgi:hypothetical protein
MTARTLLTAIAIVVASTLASLADPVGRYSVSGSNPTGGGRYSGTALVERTGDTFRVTWNINGDIYVGTGIGSDKGFAVAYRAGDQAGIAIYGAKGDGWEGVWTYFGSRAIGGEVWTRR